MLLSPTLLIAVWESMNRSLYEVSVVHCAVLCSRRRHRHFRERRGIFGWNLRRGFEHTTIELVEHKLTRNPLGEGHAHISLFVNGIYQLEKGFARILRATRRIQSFTQTLSNRNVEIIKFPSRYLSESVRAFYTLQHAH